MNSDGVEMNYFFIQEIFDAKLLEILLVIVWNYFVLGLGCNSARLEF